MEVVIPIRGGLDIEKLLDVGSRRGFQQSAEKAVGTANKLCKLADAKGGETIRADAEKAPHVCRDGFKSSPLAEGFVVGLELTRIVIGEKTFEQSRLPEKKSLDALWFVAPASQQRLRNGLGKKFERKSVGFATEIMSQKNIAALLPVATTGVEMTPHHLTLVFQTFKQEPLKTA